MISVGSNIRKLRELRGFSQEYLANKLNISQAAYSKIERESKLNFERLSEIGEVLEIDPLKIVNFDDTHVFNNRNQQGGNAASIIIQHVSEKERELYEQRIAHLEGEILFLRNQLEST